MLPKNSSFSYLNLKQSGYLLTFLACILLACSLPAIPGLGQAGPTATPTTDGVGFQVNLVVTVAGNITLTPPTPTETIAAILSETTPTPTTSTSIITTTIEATATLAEVIPTVMTIPTPRATPEGIETSEVATESEEIETTAGELYTGPLTDEIQLIGPESAYTLGPEDEQLEVKWQWLGEELRPCELPEGFGFDIRIWPALNNPYVPAWQQGSIEPLGVIDAVQDQDKISSTCDVKDSSRRFVIGNLKSVVGVAMASGQGQFHWDVAYVRLDPYYEVIKVAPQKDFFISSPAEAPTVAPTPTEEFQLTPGPRPPGEIKLIKPGPNAGYPANVSQVEFVWEWDRQDGAEPCTPLVGYGFELRLKSTRPDPDFTFLGVYDAANSEELLGCDPNTNTYSYLIPDIRTTDAVKATFVGENRWDGQFYWDVALVSTNPYRPPEVATAPNTFNIFLSDYTGSFDPFGEALKCTDFPSWIEAQAVYLKANEQVPNPQRDLDPDGDDVACDELRQ